MMNGIEETVLLKKVQYIIVLVLKFLLFCLILLCKFEQQSPQGHHIIKLGRMFHIFVEGNENFVIFGISVFI